MNKIEFVEQFKKRTKEFALRVIKLYRKLPKTGEAKVIGDHLLRAALSVAFNYRAASRSRSNAEFFSKMSIVVEEADESASCLELLIEAEIMKEELITDLLEESYEILKIVSKARKTASNNR